MNTLIQRWQRAAQRASDEKIRIVRIGGELYATSSSSPLGAYRLERSEQGWTCQCVANSQYGLPCKHLSALADAINLDVLSDVHVDWESLESPGPAV